MAGLVGYGSSDEESEESLTKSVQNRPQSGTAHTQSQPETPSVAANSQQGPLNHQEVSQAPQASQSQPEHADQVPIGPSLPQSSSLDDQVSSSLPLALETDPSQPPQSPYTANRALIHDLTLPSIPNLDIPPSPVGSPAPSTTKKIDQFLDLKRKGTHLNAKLEASNALKNPSLLSQLERFVGLDGSRMMYETTLSKDVWDPTSMPKWATKEELRKSRERVAREREDARTNGTRKTVEFTSATL